MARIRTIKPDFWTDEKVVEVSAFARLLFIGLWNFADDEGRMQCSQKKIKMQIFPADSPDLPRLLAELSGQKMITLYVIDNVDYLQINNFSKHQKVDKRYPSKICPPPESPRIPPQEWNGMEGNGMELECNGRETPMTDRSKLDKGNEKPVDNFGKKHVDKSKIICKHLESFGIEKLEPENARLLKLVEEGADINSFTDACLDVGRGKPLNYLLTKIERQWWKRDAASIMEMCKKHRVKTIGKTETELIKLCETKMENQA